MTTGGHAVIIRALRRERANIRVRLRQGTAMSKDRRQTLEYEAAVLDHVIEGLEETARPRVAPGPA